MTGIYIGWIGAEDEKLTARWQGVKRMDPDLIWRRYQKNFQRVKWPQAAKLFWDVISSQAKLSFWIWLTPANISDPFLWKCGNYITPLDSILRDLLVKQGTWFSWRERGGGGVGIKYLMVRGIPMRENCHSQKVYGIFPLGLYCLFCRKFATCICSHQDIYRSIIKKWKYAMEN